MISMCFYTLKLCVCQAGEDAVQNLNETSSLTLFEKREQENVDFLCDISH